MIDVTKLKKGVKVRYLGGDPYDDGELTVGKHYEVLGAHENGAFISDDASDAWNIRELDGNLDCFEIVDESPSQPDAVHSPAHYTQGAVEVIDYIDQVAESYVGKDAAYVANVIKYVSRAPHKNGVTDIRKAIWYAERLAESMAKREAKE